MFNCAFFGQNLHPSDVTSVNVTGSISYSPIYTFATLSLPTDWSDIFGQLVNYAPGANNSVAAPIPPSDIGNNSVLKNLAAADLLFPQANPNPGFVSTTWLPRNWDTPIK